MTLTPRSTLTLKPPELKCSNRKVPLLSATIYIITSYTIVLRYVEDEQVHLHHLPNYQKSSH